MNDPFKIAAGFPLGAPSADPPQRYEIVYTRYTYNEDDGLRGDPRSYVICRTDIENFVKERAKGDPLPPWKHIRDRGAKDPWPDPVRPIDIYLGCPCYVVIELDRSLDWQFAKGAPGIVHKTRTGTIDTDLHHVLADGTIVGPKGPQVDDCRILFFTVETRAPFEHVGFLCNIDFRTMFEGQSEDLFDPDQVDPDIPNNGGKFPMLPRSPCLGT